MKYAKIIDGNIEFAPKNYVTEDGATIINFTNDEDIMLQYGYKKFIEAEKDPTHIYIITYNETAKQIREIATINTKAEEEREEAERQAEQERIRQLHMTRGDFFEGFILATGLSIEMLRSYIDTLPLTDLEKQLYYNRFDNALDFYRGYPAVSMIGQLLGISEEQLTAFFETKDYHNLIPNITTQQITGL